MDAGNLLDLYDQDQRIGPCPPGFRIEVAPHTIRQLNLRGTRSCVIHSHLAGIDVDRCIQEEITRFNGLNHSFEWKVFSHDLPADLIGRLSRFGFAVEETEIVMVGSLTDDTTGGQAPAHPVRWLVDPGSLDELRGIHGDDALIARLREELQVLQGRMGVCVALAEGRAVSAGWVYCLPGCRFATLWGGHTLPEFRGRGYYRSLLAARMEFARRLRFQWVAMDAGSLSAPIVSRLGFRPLTRATACVHEPP